MSVIGLVSAVAGFVKIRYVAEKAIIDNLIFRCHYRLTTAVLLLACVLVTANNLIGEPIACITDGAIPGHVINTYCWITTTFTLPTEHGSIVGEEVPHPGVANHLGGKETRHHAYYQWVPFMLFFQGVLFYVPHWIWKNWEEGKIRHLTDGLRGAATVTGAEKDARQSKLVQYIFDTLHRNNVYATGYYICEVFNFVNVIFNMFLVDIFLGGAFMRYGTEVIKFSGLPQESRYDPMVAVFPRVTKCTFHKYGPSGTVQRHDALCVLALNILNEKIYIFLWFWFIMLAVMSGFALVYSTAIVLLPSIREKILIRRFRFGTPAGVSALVAKTQVGDFLLLHLMGQNMNMMVFGEFLDELSRKLHLGNNIPTAPSTMELSPIYPSAKLRSLETEA